MKQQIESYIRNLHQTLTTHNWGKVEHLAERLLDAVEKRQQVFICGNGGSAGNAMHLANDFIYGIAPGQQTMRIEALPANQSVLTCLGNDIGYENIYSYQLKIKGQSDDVLIVLSGSGNSPNILNAVKTAKDMGICSYGILGFNGGKAKALVDHAIHFEINDMQIAEDTQLIVGHILMQYMKSVMVK